ncbi:hypothetical protein BVRB_036370 [Beta vulgaris subsp. vulgaris]|uniref:Uncharacterized protein n=1 Tax=Beta vulgaris subsp. vulgaris TaxID=3555 RepID=A0A0J8BI65_BETVV|nr:hypothetical protein BVRB_036370 [Beta vulgaris subsp. vulgaris]
MPPSQKPIPKGFTCVRCPTSTDQVMKVILSCSFDDCERFEFYHMSYMSKNQKELEFPYSPTQQLSVVIPDHLFVVDSICECMSTIPETVVSLKSKKKSFFRALTNLGFAHKMQAKRMKKFQKQAWCATLPGTMEWIKRVRGFSTNTLHIDDLELERLIQFIETRVVPILEHWQSIEQITMPP